MICHHTAAHAYLDRLAALAVDDALRLLPAGMRAHRWVLALCLEPDCDYELARFVPLVGGRPGESHGSVGGTQTSCGAWALRRE